MSYAAEITKEKYKKTIANLAQEMEGGSDGDIDGALAGHPYLSSIGTCAAVLINSINADAAYDVELKLEQKRASSLLTGLQVDAYWAMYADIGVWFEAQRVQDLDDDSDSGRLRDFIEKHGALDAHRSLAYSALSLMQEMQKMYQEKCDASRKAIEVLNSI